MTRIIGTWKMSLDGIREATDMLLSGASAGDAVEHAILRVEDEPSYCSVGYGGLPDLDGHVMTDAAFMDGNRLRAGAVMSAEHVANPIRLARKLCGRDTNWLLAGRGAEQAAIAFGLPMRDIPGMTRSACWRWTRQAAWLPAPPPPACF